MAESQDGYYCYWNLISLFQIDLENKKVVEFLSRIQNDNNDIPVEDNFPDEYVFAISNKYPWFANISNYLATGKLPSYFFSWGKNKDNSNECILFMDK